MRIELCPLGIDWVDGLIGGVPLWQTSLVTGAPRTGRTCVALGFAIQALERGRVCFVTSDAPESVLELGTKYLGRDFRPDVEMSRLSILSLAPFFESKLRSLASPEGPLAELAGYLRHKQMTFLVIDTIDAFLSWAGDADAKRVVRELLAGLRGAGATTLVTATRDNVALDALEADVSSAIDLSHEAATRTLSIRSASWCRVDSTPVPFELVQRRGIRVLGADVASAVKRADGTDVFNVSHLPVVDSLPPIKMTRKADPDATDVLPAVPKISSSKRS